MLTSVVTVTASAVITSVAAMGVSKDFTLSFNLVYTYWDRQ